LLVVAIAVFLILMTRQDDSGALPVGDCSAVQIERGCAPGFCSDGRCRCTPNYEQLDASRCAKPLANSRMNFFVYQVLADNESACVAPEAHSLQGVVWHLHNEVVTQSCPRRMHRSRVARCRAAVFNTEQPFLEWKGQFGPYTNFNEGKCVSPGCEDVWRNFGFVVGCLPWAAYMGGADYGNRSHVYSFPHQGRCAAPNGTANCTWNLQAAGEVRLDDLENISDYRSFCKSGGVEYDKGRDCGKGCSFWDNQSSSVANARRLQRLQQLFGEGSPEPSCDSQNAACHYHQHCRNLSGNCCPAGDGMMLSCCGRPSFAVRSNRLFT